MQQTMLDLPRNLDEFRIWHERQPEVFEFIDGVPILMAPGSMTDTILKSRIGGLLAAALPGSGCEVLVDGAIVEIEGSSLIPDVVVTCEPVDLSTPRIDKPIIIVEVLSPSGEKDDLSRKLMLYIKIPALRHYLAVAQDTRRIIHHERPAGQEARFITTVVGGEVLRLEPPGIDLSLSRIYDGLLA